MIFSNIVYVFFIIPFLQMSLKKCFISYLFTLYSNISPQILTVHSLIRCMHTSILDVIFTFYAPFWNTWHKTNVLKMLKFDMSLNIIFKEKLFISTKYRPRRLNIFFFSDVTHFNSKLSSNKQCNIMRFEFSLLMFTSKECTLLHKEIPETRN